MKKILGLLLVLILVTSTFAACGTGNASDSEEVERGGSNENTAEEASIENSEGSAIGLVLLYDDNQALEPMIWAVESVAAEHGDKVLVYGAEGNVANVADCIDKAISAGVKGIVLHNSDDISNAAALENARDAGIPVAVVDSRFKGDQDLVLSQTAVDNYMAGYLGGKALVKDLNGEGNIVMLEYTSNESWAQRSVGFEDAIKDSNINIIAREQILAAVEENNTLMENLLQRFEGSDTALNAVWGFAGGNAVGACAALKAAGRDDVKVYCIDGSQMELDLIESGELVGTSYLNLYSIAYEGVLDVYNYLETGEKPEVYLKTVDSTWVDASNVAEYSNITDIEYIPATAAEE